MEFFRSRPGWVEVITGSMFSGKSEEMIRRLRRAQIARQRVQIFKPQIDSRYGGDHIVSHSEMRIEAELVHNATDCSLRPQEEKVCVAPVQSKL